MSILTFIALIFLILFAAMLLLKKKFAPKKPVVVVSEPLMPVVNAESEMNARMAKTIEKTEIETVQNADYTSTHITHDASHIENLPIEVKEENR